MSDGTKIESVYEPGFGETGPQKPEDQVMFENPIGVYGLTDESSIGYKKQLVQIGDSATPKDVILFAEKGEKMTIYEQTKMAMIYANEQAVKEPGFPLIEKIIEIPGGYSLHQSSPVVILHKLNSDYTNTNRESGVKTPEMQLVLAKKEGASDQDYIKARFLIIQKANKTLQLFDAKFRIPQFPIDSELKKV